MATIFKTLVGTIASGNTSIVFTDENINNDSLIDVYFSNSEIDYNISQINNSVTVEIEKQSSVTGVALFINNSDSVDYPITAQDVSYFDTSVYYELLEHKIELNSLTTAIGTLDNIKQDTLTPGDNITIENNVISASGGSSVNYSNEEKKIGKWINGKDLYQITVVLTPPTGSNVFSNGIVGATQICNYEALYKMDNSDSVIKPPSYLTDNTRKLIFESMNNTLVETFVGTSFDGIKLYLTVQYTKD